MASAPHVCGSYLKQRGKGLQERFAECLVDATERLAWTQSLHRGLFLSSSSFTAVITNDRVTIAEASPIEHSVRIVSHRLPYMRTYGSLTTLFALYLTSVSSVFLFCFSHHISVYAARSLSLIEARGTAIFVHADVNLKLYRLYYQLSWLIICLCRRNPKWYRLHYQLSRPFTNLFPATFRIQT